MKRLSKNLSRRVLATLNKDPNFKDAYQMVCNRSKTKPYLVGGKLYRTLIELIYDYPARSHSCDFDFAAVEINKKKKKKKNKRRLTSYISHDGPQYISVADATDNLSLSGVQYKKKEESPYNGESITMRTDSGAKIDLISIPDLRAVRDGKHPATIEGYLDSVPLSIQAIAMDLDRCEIFGKTGIDSINEKYVWVNNEDVLNKYVRYKRWKPDQYVKEKADSIKFGCHVNEPKRKKVKNCGYSEPGTWAHSYDNYISQYSMTSTTSGYQIPSAWSLAVTAPTAPTPPTDTISQFIAGLSAPQVSYLSEITENHPDVQPYMEAGNLYVEWAGELFWFDGTAFTIVSIDEEIQLTTGL